MTDYYRRIKGVKAADMWPAPVRSVVRTPGWVTGGAVGGAVNVATGKN
ncbi:hypothetical protein [Celeribacter neptunius]|nr:hypothetical protein [Celeribacter neptunius]